MHGTLAIGLEYPLSLRGGVSVLVETLVTGLADRWKIVLISPEETSALNGHPLKQLLFQHIPFYQTAKPPNRAFSLQRDELIGELCNLGVDVLHLHCGGVYGWGNRWPRASVARAARNAGMRVFWTNHLVVSLFDGFCGKNKPAWLKLAMFPVGWLGKLDQMAAVEREIAVSEHDKEKMADWYFPLRSRLLRIYHSRLADTPSSQSSAKSPIILSVGHIAFRKGQHILAEAFVNAAKDLPGWQLWIAGHDGGDGCWQRIEAIRDLSGLGDRLQLLGARSDSADLMENASVFAQPSLEEALGLALQEALFEGCACIGTDAGGIPELISDGENGLLVPKNNVVALAKALIELCNSDYQREQFAKAGAKSVLSKKMTSAGMLASYIQILE